MLLAALATVAALRARRRGKTPSTKGRGWVSVLTVVAAVIATAASAQGMWNFFGDVFHVNGPLRVALFALFEIALMVFALNARQALDQNRSAGFDGVAVWLLAITTGVLSAMDAGSVRGIIGRLLVPLVAAMLWERDLILRMRQARAEARKLAGGVQDDERRIRWRITPERILVRLRMADSTDRTAADVDATRWLLRLAKAAYTYHSLKEAGAKPRRVDRADNRLRKRIQQSVQYLNFADGQDPVTRCQAYLAALYNVHRDTAPAALAHVNPWQSTKSLSTQLQELTAELESTRATLIQREAELAHTTTALDELESTRKELARLADDSVDARTLTAELESTRATLIQREAELAHTTTALDELESTRKELIQREAELAHAGRIIADLRQTSAALPAESTPGNDLVPALPAARPTRPGTRTEKIDKRVSALADRLGKGDDITTAVVQKRYEISERTARRLLNQARELLEQRSQKPMDPEIPSDRPFRALAVVGQR